MYESDEWSVKRHLERKHKEHLVGRAPTTVSVPPHRIGAQYGNGVQAATSHQHASNHHPYLNHANQVGFGVQSIHQTRLMAQNPHK